MRFAGIAAALIAVASKVAAMLIARAL